MAEIVTLKSFPFDSMEVLNEESGQMEPDRLYEAETFRKYFAKFLSTGVYFGDYKNYKENSMKVTADGGLNIRVATGAGIIEGVDYENETDKIFTLERPVSGNRIDRVIVRLDKTLAERNTYLLIKTGNGTTVAELQRDENIYEICLAEVTVKSTTNIEQADIVDKRINKEVCGIVNSLISIDGEEIYQQFKNYIESIKSNLMLKNQNNTCVGTIIAQRGFEGDVVGNSTTASKLATVRNIALSGAVKGNVNFDGSENVTINTLQNNIFVLDGIISANSGSETINYPSNLNKNNCIVLASMFNTGSTGAWGIGTVFNSSSYILGGVPNAVILKDNAIEIKIQNINLSNGDAPYVAEPTAPFNYKIVLMKIS